MLARRKRTVADDAGARTGENLTRTRLYGCLALSSVLAGSGWFCGCWLSNIYSCCTTRFYYLYSPVLSPAFFPLPACITPTSPRVIRCAALPLLPRTSTVFSPVVLYTPGGYGSCRLPAFAAALHIYAAFCSRVVLPVGFLHFYNACPRSLACILFFPCLG